MKKSMVDVAFDLMTKKKKPVVFLKLWQEVSEIMGFTVAQEEDNIAQFYSDLSLDDRFVNVAENKWDLRSRHTYDESVVDPASIMIDEDSDDGYDDEPEDKEEMYYHNTDGGKFQTAVFSFCVRPSSKP